MSINNGTERVSRRVDHNKRFNSPHFDLLAREIRMCYTCPWYEDIVHPVFPGKFQEFSFLIFALLCREPPSGCAKAVSSVMEICPVHKIARRAYLGRSTFSTSNFMIFFRHQFVYNFICSED